VLTYANIEAAAQRLLGVAHRTPIATSRTLNEMLGCEVFLKCENLQRSGSFKFRGAYNAIAALEPEQRAKGICAFSSGNHAQAVAYASKLHGITCVMLMPLDAPASKVTATKGYGAEVILFDRYTEDREALAAALQAERNLTLIPPYDNYDVMAGQGTMAKELIEEVSTLDAFIGCVGGGGLIAGCGTAVKHLLPNARIFGAEPEAGNDTQLSLHAGQRIEKGVPKTICDGQQNAAPGVLTFPINKSNLTDVLITSDDTVLEAMRFAFERMKLVIEPSGACALAALMTHRHWFAGERVGVTLSGGNVATDRFNELTRNR
jgi:threo-3-hydroxy-L-aspartate ammonia-lyase